MRRPLVDAAIDLAEGNGLSSLNITFCTEDEAQDLEGHRGLLHRITQQFSSSARGVKTSYKNVGALVDSSKVKDATHVQAYVKVECPRRQSLCGWRTTCAMTLLLG
jgi:predicted N-acyltransferase